MEEITGAQNFNFAFKFFQNGVFLGPHFSFFGRNFFGREENFPTG